VQNAEELGLSGGTMYDVVGPNPGSGNVTVNATGFDISCGHFTNVIQQDFVSVDHAWHMQVDDGNHTVTYTVSDPGAYMLSGYKGVHRHFHTARRYISSIGQPFIRSIVLMSTIPLVDSGNNFGPSATLDPPMHDNSISSVQLIRCSLSLVNQTAVVDAQSRKLIAVYPNIAKTVSSWAPYTGPYDGPTGHDGDPTDHDYIPLSIDSPSENFLLDAVRIRFQTDKSSAKWQLVDHVVPTLTPHLNVRARRLVRKSGSVSAQNHLGHNANSL
jgi:hypothetical protein